MKLHIQTLTFGLTFIVILLAGCSGCGLATDSQTPQQVGITPNGQETPDQQNAIGDAETLKVKIGWQPSGGNPLLKSSKSNRAPSDTLEGEESGNTERNWRYPKLSREFSDHVDKVNQNSNNYFSNPNYWQEKYDLIDEYLGLDTESTVRFIVEHEIYTEVIVKYLDDYDAYRYVLEYAPRGETGPATDAAERVFANEPGSLKGLDTGLHLAANAEDIGGDNTEAHTAYLAVLRHHPDNVAALFRLGRLFLYDEEPEGAIPLFEKANRLVPTHFNFNLGQAYDLLGDYKTAWVYFKKELNARKQPKGSHTRNSTRRMLYVYEVEQDPPPPVSTSTVDPLSMSVAELMAFVNWEKSLSTDTPIDINPFLAQEIRAHIRGEASPFKPSRLVRAFEQIHRHGKKEGIKRLEQSDPELANKVKLAADSDKGNSCCEHTSRRWFYRV